MGESGKYSAEGWMAVAPQKYHVILRVNQDWDEWLTIDADHYRNTGLWSKIEEPGTSDWTLRLPLNLPNWAAAIRAGTLTRAFRTGLLEHYTRFEIRDVTFPHFENLGVAIANIWVENQSSQIVKAVLVHNDQDKTAEIDQMFTSHNGPVSIWAPRVNMDQAGTIISNRVDIIPRWGIFQMGRPNG